MTDVTAPDGYKVATEKQHEAYFAALRGEGDMPDGYAFDGANVFRPLTAKEQGKEEQREGNLEGNGNGGESRTS